MLIPIILCGGFGNRLWPLSRESYPKQLLKLTNELSLFQNTLLSAARVCKTKPIIITNESYRFMIKEQLDEISLSPQVIILEYEPKDTAAALALCCFYISNLEKEGRILALPSDHVFIDQKNFEKSIKDAETGAKLDKIITFGIAPISANIAYGYIKRGNPFDTYGYEIEKFIEKPNQETANRYIKDKDYYWNSGIFLTKAKMYLEELKKYSPDIYYASKKIYNSHRIDSFNFMHFEPRLFENCPKLSIDYAIMEKTKNAIVIPIDMQWADIGSWNSLWELKSKDENGNVLQGDVVVKNVNNSFIHSEGRLIAAIGLNNIIIAETRDAILVSDKEHSQEVKNIVKQLKEKKRKEVESPTRVYRPWGYFETLVSAGSYNVKRLMIKPNARLSLQTHSKRSEHWIVVSGIANIIRGEDELQLKENESIYIPIGCKHRLANLQKNPLYVIEVQTGSYFGEDDIVRFDDVYQRTKKQPALCY